MSLFRTFAILRKEFHHIARDGRLLFLVTVSPALLLWMFAYVFAMDLGQLTMAVMDQDRTRLSRDYQTALIADGDVRLVAEVASYDVADHMLRAGQADVILVVPPGFEEDARAGRSAQVQLLVDGADVNTARQTVNQFTARTYAYAANLTALNPNLRPLLEVRSRALYNPSLKSLLSMVPALMGVFLVMPALALSLALTREKEMGTFESLIATPVRGIEYLVGKLAAYVSAGLVSAIIAMLVAILWFHVPFRGQFAVFLLLTVVFFGANMGLSLILANFIKNQQTVMLVMLLMSFVPSFFLSGLLTPIDTSSVPSVALSNSLPTTHFITIGRGIFLKGLTPAQMAQPVLALLAMGAVAMFVSAVSFRKRME
jgi:ABC-2 type transport system permease protein